MDELVERVAAATIRRHTLDESWKRGLAIQGLLDCSLPDARTTAVRWLQQDLALADDQDQVGLNDWRSLTEGHVRGRIHPNCLGAPLAYSLLELVDGSDETADHLAAAQRTAEALIGGPRAASGAFFLLHGMKQVFIDTLFLHCPLLARLAAITGDDRYVDEVSRQFESHFHHLHDERKGLFRHTWNEQPDYFPQSTFWSRGNGWVGLALMDCVRWIGQDALQPQIELYLGHLDAVLEYQDRSGAWRNTLDDPDGRLEASGTLLVAYAIARGVALGLVSERYLARATAAMRSVTAMVDDDGNVTRVTVEPGGPRVPFGVTTFGQGLFLMAAAALRDVDGLPRPVGA